VCASIVITFVGNNYVYSYLTPEINVRKHIGPIRALKTLTKTAYRAVQKVNPCLLINKSRYELPIKLYFESNLSTKQQKLVLNILCMTSFLTLLVTLYFVAALWVNKCK